MRDLTEQKAGEESLLRGIQLAEENQRVQEASRLKSEFLANMSHELRTPLNAIIGFAELLYDGQVTPDMPQFKDFMHDILTSGQHLLQLINDVLDLSKVEAGRLEFHPEETDIRQIVGESIGDPADAGRAKADRHRAGDRAGASRPRFVDRARLKQVLYNYLSNAIKFTPEKGRIPVRVVAEDADHFRIEVTDTGIGISAEDLPRLFIEFNQLEAGAAKKHQGTGLGLALTRRLVEAQGGSVGVRSTPGAGQHVLRGVAATRHARHADGRPPQHRFAAARCAVGARHRGQRRRSGHHRALARRRPASMSRRRRPRAQALVKLEAQAFDAITLDLILPDANGADVLSDLRTNAAQSRRADHRDHRRRPRRRRGRICGARHPRRSRWTARIS